MPGIKTEADWRAEMDLEALQTADEVRASPGRQAGIRRHIQKQRDALNQAESRVARPSGFNGAVRSKRSGRS